MDGTVVALCFEEKAKPRLSVTLPLIAQNKVDEIGDLHDYHRFKPGASHYDYGNGGDEAGPTRNERRLILSAECQVGKTGAYLHYLQLLKRAASFIPALQPLPLNEGFPPRDIVSWLLPNWKTLSHKDHLSKMYGSLFASKYTAGVAEKRAYLVVESCKREGPWVANFQRLLSNVCEGDEGEDDKVFGETITSQVGQKLLAELTTKLPADKPPFEEDGQPVRTGDAYKSLQAAIDWDKIFHISHGVRLCPCDGQCECQATAVSSTSTGTFGTPPAIRMADLAETGGQRDGVRRKWKAPHGDPRGEKRALLPLLFD